MQHKLIEPPFDVPPGKMTLAQLRQYREWFHQNLPERGDILAHAVRTTPGFELWKGDRSPESLIQLGAWLGGVLETRPLPSEKVEDLQRGLPSWINVPRVDFTPTSLSIIFDVGIYFAMTLLAARPELRWDQVTTGTRRRVEFGECVIVGFPGPLNPIEVVRVVALKMVDQKCTTKALRDLFDFWHTF